MSKKVTAMACTTLFFGSIMLSQFIFGFSAALTVGIIGAIIFVVLWLVKKLSYKDALSMFIAFGPIFSQLIENISDFSWLTGLTDQLNRLFWASESAPEKLLSNATVIKVFFWIVVLIIWIALIAKEQQEEESAELKQKNYRQKSQNYCISLRQRIEALNKDTDWNASWFTPIEAEVEMSMHGRRTKRYGSLLQYLKHKRRDKTIFLVLGAPGSGKSVSLRKLSLELLRNEKKVKQIPAYINLKDWTENWSLEHIPNQKDLIVFIKKTLLDNSDPITEEFLNKYFELMLENGRWYFILDSFDELPCFMGRDNCGELIDKISRMIQQFLTGPNQNGGIIASRLFKAPSDALKATVTLRIQEFSDLKIRTMIKKSLNNTKDIVTGLFGKREDLVALCRTPLYLSLLIDHIREKGIDFPANQMALYQSFVLRRLGKHSDGIAEAGLTVQKVYDGAKRLAKLMQETPGFGLYFPTKILYTQPEGSSYWKSVLKILKNTRICRIGGAKETVTFVHRRFQEFFFVKGVIDSGKEFDKSDYNSILYDSGLRDALVLFCEVAGQEKAKEIAGFCWNTIRDNLAGINSIHKQGTVQLVNALYFLADAFQNRKEAIQDFYPEFKDFVEENLAKAKRVDFVVLLALVNSMVLLMPEDLEKNINGVFKIRNQRLDDIVLNNFRMVKHINGPIFERMYVFYTFRLGRSFWGDFRNHQFAFSFSRNLIPIRILLWGIAIIRIWSNLLLLYLFVERFFGITSINLLKDALMGTLAMSEDRTVFDIITSAILLLVSSYFIPILFLSYETSIDLIPLTWRSTSFSLTGLFCDEFLMTRSLTTVLLLLWKANMIAYKKHLLILSLYIPEVLNFLMTRCWLVKSGVIQRRLSWQLKNLRTTWKITLSSFAVIGVVFLLVKHFPIVKKLLVLAFPVFWIAAALIYWIIILYTHIKDAVWVERRPDIRTIQRIDLDKQLKKLHSLKWRRTYIDMLLQNKVELAGEWPDQIRPQFNDWILDEELAKLDCAKLESLNRWR